MPKALVLEKHLSSLSKAALSITSCPATALIPLLLPHLYPSPVLVTKPVNVHVLRTHVNLVQATVSMFITYECARWREAVGINVLFEAEIHIYRSSFV